MTSTSPDSDFPVKKPKDDQTDSISYPTKWKMLDGFARLESRQISNRIWEMRDPDGIVTLHYIGYNLYKSGKNAEFIQWLKANNVEIRDRDDK